jgi:hypothetical protein
MAQSTEVSAILLQMNQEIGAAHGRWNGLLYGMQAAYAAAYDSQTNILGAVKETIDARKAQREAQISFILSLIAVGIGGPKMSSFFTSLDAGTKYLLQDRKMLTAIWERKGNIASSLQALDKVDPMISDWLKGVSGISTGSADTSQSAFKPPAMSPSEFGATLLQNVQETANLMTSAILDLLNNGAPLTAAEANLTCLSQLEG